MAKSGDIFPYHSREVGWLGWLWHWWAEARDAAKCPVMHETVPTAKQHAGPNVTSTKAEKLCSNTNPFKPRTALRGRNYYIHFIDEEPGAQEN